MDGTLIDASVAAGAALLTGGKRKMTSVSEITGMEGDLVQMHE